MRQKPGIEQAVERVARREAAALVAVAVEREHRVGSGLDLAADAAREVHAEEREAGIGHRIDEAFDQVAALAP